MTNLIIAADRLGKFTKSTMLEIATDLMEGVFENNVSALETDVKLKAFEEIIKISRLAIEGKVKEEIGANATFSGVKTEIRNGYAAYNYEEDSTYASLNAQLKAREEILKQAAKSESEIVIDGELITKVSVKSYSKDSIIYTFSK